MAQVTRRDRGQMILLMGVVLAVMFVALALLVNAAIYTDNVATRGGDPAAEALEYQNGVVNSTEGLIKAENTAGEATNGDVRPALENISNYHRRYHLRRGAATSTTFDIYEGRNITKANITASENWEASASDVRGFVIDIDGENMTISDQPFDVILPTENVTVNKTSKGILVNDTSNNILCKGRDSVMFNITNASFGGEPCGFDTSSFDDGGKIGIDRKGNGAGSYEAIFESETDTTDLPSGTVVFIYRVELDLRIDTPELQYERTVEVVSEVPDVT